MRHGQGAGGQVATGSEVTGALGFTPASVLVWYAYDDRAELLFTSEEVDCGDVEGHSGLPPEEIEGVGNRLLVTTIGALPGPEAWDGAYEILDSSPSLVRYECIEESPGELRCPNLEWFEGDGGELWIAAVVGDQVQGTLHSTGIWYDFTTGDLEEVGAIDVDAEFTATLCPHVTDPGDPYTP